MKMFVIVALVVGLAAAGARAQTAEPAPASTPSSSAAPSANAAPAKPTGKEAREQCKADAKAQGLKGDARKAAVDDCFAKARPDLAARQKCRAEGKAKGLADDELKAYVKSCYSASK